MNFLKAFYLLELYIILLVLLTFSNYDNDKLNDYIEKIGLKTKNIEQKFWPLDSNYSDAVKKEFREHYSYTPNTLGFMIYIGLGGVVINLYSLRISLTNKDMLNNTYVKKSLILWTVWFFCLLLLVWLTYDRHIVNGTDLNNFNNGLSAIGLKKTIIEYSINANKQTMYGTIVGYDANSTVFLCYVFSITITALFTQYQLKAGLS